MNSQALAAVGAMMAAFGQPDTGLKQAEIGCIAAHVWEEARTASFQRKLEIAAMIETEERCRIVQAVSDLENQGFTVEFSHMRDAQSWDDAILAALTAADRSLSSGGSSGKAEVDSEKARANLISGSNVLGFWQEMPVAGLDIEPDIGLLRKAAGGTSD